MNTIIEKYSDKSALVTAVGDRLIGAITDAIAARGQALIVLTGGGTGIGLLEHVRENGEAIDWSKVRLFWGDERYVPEDDDDRNEKQAREALLDHIDIPAANVHAMPASDGEFGDDIDAAALAYEQVLAAIADDGEPAPAFDVHLLGMGGEGHVNSLFPHTAAVRETVRQVVGVTDSPKPPPKRITLTLPAVQRSREVWLVVAGADKADAVAAAVGGADPDDVPAAGANGTRSHGVAARRGRGQQALAGAVGQPVCVARRVFGCRTDDVDARCDDIARITVALSALHAGQTPSRPRRFRWMWSNDRHGGQGWQQTGARTGRERIQKLAQAALNADVTVDQVDALLAGLGETLEDLNNSTGNLDATLERFNDTISRINELAPRLNAVVDRLEGIVDRVERIVGIGEAAMAPLAATESAVRGAINAVRRTTRI